MSRISKIVMVISICLSCSSSYAMQPKPEEQSRLTSSSSSSATSAQSMSIVSKPSTEKIFPKQPRLDDDELALFEALDHVDFARFQQLIMEDWVDFNVVGPNNKTPYDIIQQHIENLKMVNRPADNADQDISYAQELLDALRNCGGLSSSELLAKNIITSTKSKAQRETIKAVFRDALKSFNIPSKDVWLIINKVKGKESISVKNKICWFNEEFGQLDELIWYAYDACTGLKASHNYLTMIQHLLNDKKHSAIVLALHEALLTIVRNNSEADQRFFNIIQTYLRDCDYITGYAVYQEKEIDYTLINTHNQTSVSFTASLATLSPDAINRLVKFLEFSLDMLKTASSTVGSIVAQTHTPNALAKSVTKATILEKESNQLQAKAEVKINSATVKLQLINIIMDELKAQLHIAVGYGTRYQMTCAAIFRSLKILNFQTMNIDEFKQEILRIVWNQNLESLLGYQQASFYNGLHQVINDLFISGKITQLLNALGMESEEALLDEEIYGAENVQASSLSNQIPPVLLATLFTYMTSHMPKAKA